jgi:hypothetical protein
MVTDYLPDGLVSGSRAQSIEVCDETWEAQSALSIQPSAVGYQLSASGFQLQFIVAFEVDSDLALADS